MATMLQEALDYADRGWAVFPCREKPGETFVRNGESITPSEKTPYTSKGLNDASTDPDQIRAWWEKWPDACIGINAGKSGLFVVDIDKKHVNGLDTFTTWNINDSAGLHSITPSGGMHIVFSGNGKSGTNAKTGIDTRGEGGYFIAPPSKILAGEYTGEYKRFDDWGRFPGVIPDGLMAKLFPDKTVEYVRGNTTPLGEGQIKQLSRATLNFLANGAEKGERNAILFKALADFCGCGYTKENAIEAVKPVSERIGLNSDEFIQVLEHAYSKPRTASIPDAIQEKIVEGGKNVAAKITDEEQVVLEDALLACLLINNSLIPVVNDVLNFDDFKTFKNRVIYKAINRLYNSGVKVDYLTVSNEVSKETQKVTLDDISKMLNQYLVNTDNVTTYAYIIQQKSSIRKLEALLDNKSKYLKIGNLPEMVSVLEKDVADVAIYAGAKTTTVLDSKQAGEMVEERTRKLVNGEIEQLKIGFSEYDYHIGGLYSGDFVVLAAYAGDGKSSLALSIAAHVGLIQNKAVAIFSLEMSTHENICRLICQLTGIPFQQVYTGKLDDKEWKRYGEAMDRIKASKMYWDDGFGVSVPEIRAKIRKLTEKDIKLIIIDQLEQVKGYEGKPEYQRYNNIAYDIKDLTKEFDTPIILNHQLNRSSTDRKLKNPELQLSDLNQAGEKPATQVWTIMHNRDEHKKIMQSKVSLLKNRNGPKIEFAVIFVGDRMLFSNPVRAEDKYVFHSGDEDDGGLDTSGTNSDPYWVKENQA
jgi:replicative DNA helicase